MTKMEVPKIIYCGERALDDASTTDDEYFQLDSQCSLPQSYHSSQNTSPSPMNVQLQQVHVGTNATTNDNSKRIDYENERRGTKKRSSDQDDSYHRHCHRHRRNDHPNHCYNHTHRFCDEARRRDASRWDSHRRSPPWGTYYPLNARHEMDSRRDFRGNGRIDHPREFIPSHRYDYSYYGPRRPATRDESYDRRRYEEEGRLPFGRNDRGQF